VAICRIAFWAFRDKVWPMEGTDLYDLREMRAAALGWKEEGLTHFPVDDDVGFDEFIAWTDTIIAAAGSQVGKEESHG